MNISVGSSLISLSNLHYVDRLEYFSFRRATIIKLIVGYSGGALNPSGKCYSGLQINISRLDFVFKMI